MSFQVWKEFCTYMSMKNGIWFTLRFRKSCIRSCDMMCCDMWSTPVWDAIGLYVWLDPGACLRKAGVDAGERPPAVLNQKVSIWGCAFYSRRWLWTYELPEAITVHCNTKKYDMVGVAPWQPVWCYLCLGGIRRDSGLSDRACFTALFTYRNWKSLSKFVHVWFYDIMI